MASKGSSTLTARAVDRSDGHRHNPLSSPRQISTAQPVQPYFTFAFAFALPVAGGAAADRGATFSLNNLPAENAGTCVAGI